MTSLDAIGFAALTSLALSSVTWFFVVRRVLIAWIRDAALTLESLLKPRDKLYVYLGYLVGFRAVYEGVNHPCIRAASVVYTVAPRHVLLYAPLAARRGERLDMRLLLREPLPLKAMLECKASRCRRKGHRRALEVLEEVAKRASQAGYTLLHAEMDGDKGELRIVLRLRGSPTPEALAPILSEACRLTLVASR